jgi:hypothetical protein
MDAFIAIVLASLLSRLGYQMARSPVLLIFAADLGALPGFGSLAVHSTTAGNFKLRHDLCLQVIDDP